MSTFHTTQYLRNKLKFFFYREDACKVLVDVYGANIDIRDFSGKKAFNYLKANQQEKKMEGVCFDINVVHTILQVSKRKHCYKNQYFVSNILLFICYIFFLGKV